MKNWTLLLLIALVAVAITAARPEPNTQTGEMNNAKSQFTVTPIGRIAKEGEQTFIRLEARHQDGLLGLEEWSHIWVFYWFDRNDTFDQTPVIDLKLYNPGNDRPQGKVRVPKWAGP